MDKIGVMAGFSDTSEEDARKNLMTGYVYKLINVLTSDSRTPYVTDEAGQASYIAIDKPELEKYIVCCHLESDGMTCYGPFSEVNSQQVAEEMMLTRKYDLVCITKTVHVMRFSVEMQSV